MADSLPKPPADPSKSPMKVNDAARARQRPREPSGETPTKDARPRDDLDREVRRVDKKSRNQSTFVDMRPTADGSREAEGTCVLRIPVTAVWEPSLVGPVTRARTAAAAAALT